MIWLNYIKYTKQLTIGHLNSHKTSLSHPAHNSMMLHTNISHQHTYIGIYSYATYIFYTSFEILAFISYTQCTQVSSLKLDSPMWCNLSLPPCINNRYWGAIRLSSLISLSFVGHTIPTLWYKVKRRICINVGMYSYTATLLIYGKLSHIVIC